MQLFEDSDTDIGAETKMSTIQQETISEKFINTSPIENVHTNGSDESVMDHEIVDNACEDETAQPTETSQKSFVNEISNDEYEALRIYCDKKSAKNKKNDETEKDSDIETINVHKVNETVNNMVASEVPVEEIMEIEFNHLENSCELDSKTIQEENETSILSDKMDNKGVQDKMEEQIKESSQNEKDDTQGDVSNSVTENKVKYQVNSDIENTNKITSVIDDKFKELNQENLKMDVTVEEHTKMNSVVVANKIEEVENTTENQCADNMEVDIPIEEKAKAESSLTSNKVVEVFHDVNDLNKNQGDYVTIEKQDKVSATEHIVPVERQGDDFVAIEKQVNVSVTEDIVKVDSGIENNIENRAKITRENEVENEENSKMDILYEENQIVNSNVIISDGKIENANDENSELNVTFQEQITSCVTEKRLEIKSKIDNEIDNPIEDVIKKATSEIENENGLRKEGGFSENSIISEEQNKVNVSVTRDEIQNLHTVPDDEDTIVEEIKEKIEKPMLLNSVVIKENKTEEQPVDNNDKINMEKSEIQDNFDEQHDQKIKILYKIAIAKENEEERLSNDSDVEQVQNSLEIETLSIPFSIKEDSKAYLDKTSKENLNANELSNKQQVLIADADKIVDCNSRSDESDDKPSIVSCDLEVKSNKSDKISPEAVNLHNEKAKMSKDVENINEINKEKMFKNAEQKLITQEMQDYNMEKSSNTYNNDTESRDIEMDTDEVIDIVDEKDEDDKKKPEDSSMNFVEKAKSSLECDSNKIKSIVPVAVEVENDNSAVDASVQKENVDLIKLKKPEVEEKKKLTHISKLSNTLDILSDDEDELPKEEPQKEILGFTEKECMSINIDDDDDIMLIDEESSPKSDDKNQKETVSESVNEAILKPEGTEESREKEPYAELANNKDLDTIQAPVSVPSIIEKNSNEPEQNIVQEKSPSNKKPLLQMNFLKTCKKNLADMTRDELEEFCILKIVESVVDRSNFSEMKSQLKVMAQNIEEYKKKASILVKQNRDLQVVLKSVQEEQKKKSNMPITPLKITRSVGMQVLMTDKAGARKKTQNPSIPKNNATANNGSNRKTAQNQTKVQKTPTNTTNNSPQIPVPRLVPAVNNNFNNMKIPPPPATTPSKLQVSGPVNNSSIQSSPNAPAAAPVQKPEKRPHSRMQPSSSVTVDLTDDEPPAKVISRSNPLPVRLVPPQNLLAPHRQPFGQNVSNPRKVYIPISGSQAPVAVRPGQAIMLKTISPQGPRQRLPAPGAVKPNQGPNPVRMQRVPNRHPAPLPESVKQYQPQNWKALPPAPELKLSKAENGIVISWKIDGYQEENYEEIASYQLYAYQETTSPPSTALWKKIGDVKALALPMACTLTQFMAGYKYYFAVRAVDVRSRLGPFSMPGSILLLNKV